MSEGIINMLLRRYFIMCCMILAFQTFAFPVKVSSISELKIYLSQDDVSVIMSPGTYAIKAVNAEFTTVGSEPYTSAVLFYFERSICTFDFTGVTILIETAVLQSVSGVMDIWGMNVVGNNTTLKNLNMLDAGSVYDKLYIRTWN